MKNVLLNECSSRGCRGRKGTPSDEWSRKRMSEMGRSGGAGRSASTRASASGLGSPSSSASWTEISAEALGSSSCVGVEDNHLSVVGFGSLLSEKSSAVTFPDMKGFRQGRLRGFRRVFAHTTPIFWTRGIASGNECASLSVEPLTEKERAENGDSFICVTQFEIPSSPEAITAWVEREHEVSETRSVGAPLF